VCPARSFAHSKQVATVRPTLPIHNRA
jgi:hypothetical protein